MSDMINNSRKRKYTHKSKFDADEWEQEYFITTENDQCVCIICNKVVDAEKSVVEGHFIMEHCDYKHHYPFGTEARIQKVQELMNEFNARLPQKSGVIKQFRIAPKPKDFEYPRSTESQIDNRLQLMNQSNMNSPIEQKKAVIVTKASFAVVENLLKHTKPFDDGEIWKEGFIKAAEILFEQFDNKSDIIDTLKRITLSRNTVRRRAEDLSENLVEILKKYISECCFLSLQFIEIIDATNITQLLIFIRMCFLDLSVREELLTILPMKGPTSGQDIYKTFKSFIAETEFPIHKLVSIMTDGAPSMVDNHNGFITFCKNDDDIPKFINYHCLLIQQQPKIADPAQRSRRQMYKSKELFRKLLEECKSGELLMHKNVCRLSQATFLQRFLNLLPEVKKYISDANELEDQKCVMDLAFLCDIVEQFNKLNMELLEENKSLTEMISLVNAFKEKLTFLEAELRRGDLKHMENMSDESTVKNSLEYTQYANIISLLLNEFGERFADVSKIENIILFMSFPFSTDINIREMSMKLIEFSEANLAEVENEIVNIRNDIFLKSKASSSQCIWNLLDQKKYPCLWNCAARLQTFFSSTFLCQITFSKMNGVQTDKYMLPVIRIALSTYAPQYEKLTENRKCIQSRSGKA